jgi:hypothetical protein
MLTHSLIVLTFKRRTPQKGKVFKGQKEEKGRFCFGIRQEGIRRETRPFCQYGPRAHTNRVVRSLALLEGRCFTQTHGTVHTGRRLRERERKKKKVVGGERGGRLSY